MLYEVHADKVEVGAYRVETVDEESEGECYIAVFMGPHAELRAIEYATYKNRQLLKDSFVRVGS